MAIGIKAFHKERVANQVTQNIIGLQIDMVRNANTWKAMALAQNPPIATLRQYLNDAAANYLTRLQWVIDLRADAVKRQRLIDILTARGWDEQEVVDTVTTLRNVAVQLRDAPKGSYAVVITICDAILAAIEPAESLWPE